jgi:hypothetical protein
LNNPWKEGLKESMEFNDLVTTGSALFTGVKIGDMDGNVLANSTSLQKRSSNKHHLMVGKSKGNGTIKVPVFSDATNYSALEISFRLHGWKLKEIVSGQISVANENISFTSGHYKLIAWSLSEKVLKAEEPLFYLLVDGKNEFSVEDISLLSNSNIYNENDEASLSLVGRSGESNSNSAKTLLHQNYPNPWDNNTKIVFELPETSDIQFTVFDANGKKVKDQQLKGKNGVNEIIIHAHEMPMAGMYNYSIRYKDIVLNKRFILINK